jgi:predicted amidohydrolase
MAARSQAPTQSRSRSCAPLRATRARPLPAPTGLPASRWASSSTRSAALALVQRSISAGEGQASVETFDVGGARVALLVDGDALHPEYARLALFAGAEIIVNPCAEQADERFSIRVLSRAARAWENHAAVVSCGLGVVLDADGRPAAAHLGKPWSAIWSYSGQVLVSGDANASSARIDLVALRERRAEPWINFPAQLRTGVYAGVYGSAARGELATVPSAHAASSPAAYDVLMMQAHQAFVDGPADRDATIGRNLDSALSLARLFCMRPTTRLVVFPEFFLQGSNGAHPHDWWEKVGIRVPGPETDRLAAFAKQCDVYVCGAILEYDPEWPLRYFNTSIIISPQGEIILRYRKLQCADLNGLLNITTPGNIYTRYVERYGYDALVPVVDTPIGRLGTLICYDSNWPELWRALALKGAEVICNPTSEIHSNRRQHWYPAKRAHAAENRFYVASANAGSEQFTAGAPITNMNRGHSALIDFNGELVACADGPGVVPLVGRIELGELRRVRSEAAGAHEGRFRPEAIADAYQRFPGFPLDCFLDQPMIEASEGPKLVHRHLEQLRRIGVIRAA